MLISSSSLKIPPRFCIHWWFLPGPTFSLKVANDITPVLFLLLPVSTSLFIHPSIHPSIHLLSIYLLYLPIISRPLVCTTHGFFPQWFIINYCPNSLFLEFLFLKFSHDLLISSFLSCFAPLGFFNYTFWNSFLTLSPNSYISYF